MVQQRIEWKTLGESRRTGHATIAPQGEAPGFTICQPQVVTSTCLGRSCRLEAVALNSALGLPTYGIVMGSKSQEVQLSKLLSFVLRHDPGSIGLELDPAGWAPVERLLGQLAATQGRQFSREEIESLVATSDKKRFTLSADRTKIRAAQGHSVQVDLQLLPTAPPPELFHGTAERFLATILNEGLKPQSRQQVHLSSDPESAIKVGQRHGKPVVLFIGAQQMAAKGFLFYLAENGVWLSDRIPPEFIQVFSSRPTEPAATSRHPKLSI